MASRGDLLRIVHSAPQTAILIDEAYFEFYGKTLLDQIGQLPNLFVARTFSKAAGLAALRIGALFARSDVISAMRRAFTPYPVNSLALTAAEAAVNDEKFLRAYAQEVLESRSQLVRGLEQLGVHVFPSAANFVLVRMGARTRDVVAGLGAKGIRVRDRSQEPGCEQCVRITAGLVEDTRRLIEALQEVLCDARP